MRNSHCLMWNMAKNVENEKCTLQDLDFEEKKPKNVENEKCTLQDLDFEEKTKKFEK